MTTGTVNHSYAARDKTRTKNAYDAHPRAVARILRPRDKKPWKLQLAENNGAKITNITLSASTVLGSSAVDTTVGTFAAVGGVLPMAIRLSDPSGNFKVLAGVLKTAKTPITAGTYPISYVVTDSAGQQFGKGFVITVT